MCIRDSLVGTALSTTEDTPEDVGNSLDLHVPMVLAFFVTGGTDDAIVLEQLDKLALRFSDVDFYTCLLYTSDAADDLTRVDLGGRRIIKKKKKKKKRKKT